MTEIQGRSGNRKGFKVFSINTTIRNPKRNRDFLTLFQPFDGKVFDDECSYAYLYELIKKGIYQVSDISSEIKEKWNNDIDLSPEEIRRAIDDNPQATGLHGRVMTQIRSLKDQGFLMFEEVRRGTYRISITKLGKDLIDNIIDPTVTYTKVMLGMHANSPVRVKLLNQSRPFLNTLFVINEVNKRWSKLGHQPKGILMHEFGTFVLSMKDCDYQACAEKIINYRLKNRYEAKRLQLQKHLRDEGILPIQYNSLIRDYPDEVFRKFEMTGLLVKHGQFAYIYINFSKYNRAKVEAIIDAFKSYKFHQFSSIPEYYAFMECQNIPWETNDFIRRKIVEEKAKVLGMTMNPSNTLEDNEELLDRIFFTHSLQKAVNRYDYDFINRELLILAHRNKRKSDLDDIPEPLRLEYLLALCFGKRYGLEGLVSNIIYDEDGLPLHCAPGGKSDIIFHSKFGSYILEPTMITSRQQQQNSETTNIVRHVKEEESKTKLKYRVMMVAPCVHDDVADFFQFKAIREDVKITPVTIERTVGLFMDSETLQSLGINYDEILQLLKNNSISIYTDKMNSYRVQQQLFLS